MYVLKGLKMYILKTLKCTSLKYYNVYPKNIIMYILKTLKMYIFNFTLFEVKRNKYIGKIELQD